MVKLIDTELKNLVWEKQRKIRQHDKSRDENEKTQIENELKDLEIKIVARRNKVMQIIQEQHDKRLSKMTEENNNQTPEQTTEKAVEQTTEKTVNKKTPRTDSIASHVERVLLMPEVKSADDAIAKISEAKPDHDRKRIKSQMNAVISQVKKGVQTRWKKYTWDNEAYQLVLKE